MSEDAWHSRALADDDAPGHSTHGADSGVHGNSKTDDLKDDRILHATGRETAPVFDVPDAEMLSPLAAPYGGQPAIAPPSMGQPAVASPASIPANRAHGGETHVGAHGETPSGEMPSGEMPSGDTPDVLRWRAEMLLDEMMIGAVDSSAGARMVAPNGNGSHEGAAHNGAGIVGDVQPVDKANGAKNVAQNGKEWNGVAPGAFELPADFEADAGFGDYDSAHDAERTRRLSPSPETGHGVPPVLPPVLPLAPPTATPPVATTANGTRSPLRIVPATGTTSDGDSTGADRSGSSSSFLTTSGPFDVTPQHDGSSVGWGVAPVEAGPSEPSRVDGAPDAGSGAAVPDWSVSPYESAPRAAHTYTDPLLYEAAGDVDVVRSSLRPTAGNGPYIPSSYSTTSRASAASAGNGAASAASNADPYLSASPVDGYTSDGYTSDGYTSDGYTSDGYTSDGGVGTGAPAAQGASTRAAAPYVGPRDPHPYDDETSRRLTAVESRYPRPAYRPPPQPYANGSGGAHSDLSYDDADAAAPGLGPVRRNPAVLNGSSVSGSLAGAMAVGGRNAKYAALLPRSTPWDVHEMEREIASLADEMARVLPPGHESSRRARHLLEKAQTIFASDPLRSAEVDYYLSQVRAIVQRSRQTLEWSMLYRKHLKHYLGAWIVFSLVCIVGAVLYAPAMTAQAADALRWSADGFWGQGFVAAWLALFSGSLGGALGARYNLHRFRQQGTGFVDRKYGLRTLILPLMGMLAGLVTFMLLGGLLWFLGISTTDSLLLTLLPAAVAFSLSALQEHIYGTRD